MAEFRMPSLGADMEAGTLVAWRKQPGDALQRGDIIAEVETEKGIIEVEVYSAGVLERLLIEPGTKVPVGTPLAILREPTAADVREVEAPKAAATVAPAQRAPAPPSAPPSARQRARELGVDLSSISVSDHTPRREDVERAARAAVAPASAARVRSSPAARRRAQELRVDLGAIHGTGAQGAITLEDVEAAAERRAAQPPQAPQPAADRQRSMRRAIGAAMARSKREIPHYYVGTTIDLGAATAWLEARNAERSVRERMLPAALLLKAVAQAARRMPDFNAYFEEGAARTQADVHLGVAISLRGGGLVAPAIHHADRLSLAELMSKLQDLVARARSGTLRSSELRDATITVTNLGDRGVEVVWPIIYAPQTAIVAFGRIAQRPWVMNGALAVRPLVQASLAADHRVTDGHLGARFLALIDQLLQEPGQL